MPLKRAVTEFGKTYKDRFALRTYPGTSVPIFIFILGWSRTKPRVTLSAQTMGGGAARLNPAFPVFPGFYAAKPGFWPVFAPVFCLQRNPAESVAYREIEKCLAM